MNTLWTPETLGLNKGALLANPLCSAYAIQAWIRERSLQWRDYSKELIDNHFDYPHIKKPFIYADTQPLIHPLDFGDLIYYKKHYYLSGDRYSDDIFCPSLFLANYLPLVTFVNDENPKPLRPWQTVDDGNKLPVFIDPRSFPGSADEIYRDRLADALDLPLAAFKPEYWLGSPYNNARALSAFLKLMKLTTVIEFPLGRYHDMTFESRRILNRYENNLNESSEEIITGNFEYWRRTFLHGKEDYMGYPLETKSYHQCFELYVKQTHWDYHLYVTSGKPENVDRFHLLGTNLSGSGIQRLAMIPKQETPLHPEFGTGNFYELKIGQTPPVEGIKTQELGTYLSCGIEIQRVFLDFGISGGFDFR